MIGEFQGPNRWLSNFWPVRVELDSVVYPSVEHAYQAAKCSNLVDRKLFSSGSPGEAKRQSRNLELRSDWSDGVKLEVMKELLTQKFTQNTVLRNKLIATGNQQLVEGNKWGDTFWGVCRGNGQNQLGRLIMEIRKQLQMERQS